MGRGYIHGATLLCVTGLMASVFVAFAPMWFTVRTEEGENQCWMGTGVWTTRYYWGSTMYGLPCDDPTGLGPMSTHHAYCDDAEPLVNKYESSNFNRDMCTATRYAKVFSVMAILCAVASCVIGLLDGYHLKLRQRFERQLALAGFATSTCTIVLIMVTALTLLFSPLFSHQHIDALSHEQVGKKYQGFSCSFQTPLHNALELLSPAAEKCVLVGPAVLVLLIGLIALALGATFFLMLARSTAAPPQPAESNADALFAPRTYSLYGAGTRRFSHLSKLQRFLLITMVPYFFVMSNAVTWAVYLLWGVTVLSTIDVGVYPLARYDADALVLDSVPDVLARALEHRLGGIMGGALLPRDRSLFHDTLNIFNFSPMTSISFFWDSGAGLIAVASFLSIFVVPISKVIVWVFYFYTPADEVRRGRVLTFIDFSGKFILANLFILQFMGVALSFTRTVVLPWWLLGGSLIVPRDYALVVEIKAGLGSGVGSVMYTLTSVLSLFVGQTMVVGHNLATAWEEDRRCTRSTSLLDATSSSTSFASALPPLLHSPASEGFDTPTLPQPPSMPPPSQSVRSASYAAAQGGEPALVPNRRSVFTALASFGSVAHLPSAAGGALPPRNTTFSGNLNPVLRSLGPSFGTRFFSVPSEDAGQDGFVGLGQIGDMGEPLHPAVEAMCDRVVVPMQGVRLRVTPLGKVVVWVLMGIYVGFLLIVQSWPLFEIHQTGLVGDVLVSPRDQFKSYSLLELIVKMGDLSVDGSSWTLQALFIVFTFIMPCVVAFALVLLWTIDMTLPQQTAFFHWIEVVTAWSSLDIFFISCVLMRIELAKASMALVSDSVPKLKELEHLVLPSEKGILTAEMHMLAGFWVLALTVLFERIAIHLVMEHCVTAISERHAEAILRVFAKTLPPADPEADGGQGSEDHLIGNAAEGLLELDAGIVFSSAARYFSSYFPRHVYAGLPRSWWGTWLVRAGLLASVELVDKYKETGSWAAAQQALRAAGDASQAPSSLPPRRQAEPRRLISLESQSENQQPLLRGQSLSMGAVSESGEGEAGGPISF